MTGNKRFAWLLLAVLLVSCGPVAKPAFDFAVKQRPEKQLRSYAFDPASSLLSRVGAAPEFVLAYLKKMDQRDSYSPYLPDRRELAMLAEYLAKLPPLHLRLMQERLVGIYFINDFQGSGLTDYVLGDRDELYTIMVLNPEAMKHDMTWWMTYREGTIFAQNDRSAGIVVQCGTAYTGLLYALLHESTHVVDYVNNFTPYADEDMNLLGRVHPETAFVAGVWAKFDRPEPRYDDPKRKRITLYGMREGPLLSLQDALPVYERLSGLPFASLYGWLSWSEDFAEYVTWHHYTRELGQPYTIEFRKNGVAVKQLSPMDGTAVKAREPSIRAIYEKG